MILEKLRERFWNVSSSVHAGLLTGMAEPSGSPDPIKRAIILIKTYSLQKAKVLSYSVQKPFLHGNMPETLYFPVKFFATVRHSTHCEMCRFIA